MLRKPENSHLSAYIGFYEIYQGHLHDLLNNRKKLHPREDGKSNVVISGLKEYEIVNVQGLMQVFEYGNNVRSTGSTNANADSSRSHAIMQIVLKDRANRSVEGKLSFIDLAGSERGADRGDTDVKTRYEHDLCVKTGMKTNAARFLVCDTYTIVLHFFFVYKNLTEWKERRSTRVCWRSRNVFGL